MRAKLAQQVESLLPSSVADLARLCAQPSVSAQKLGIEKCARLLASMMEGAGLSARVLPSPEPGYPVVYAERKGRSSKTLLFYNHYDVQPPEPLGEWVSPPFQPTERDGKLYARGVADDKGHIAARLAAIKALLKADGELPCGVKFCVEGCEEIGSPGLHRFVDEHKALLAADACLWEGGGVDWQGRPSITLGLKGILYVELECRTASRDSHSSFGTVAPNAAWRLAWALSTIKDRQERVLIPGFYADVRPPTGAELAAVDALPAEDEELKRSLDLSGFVLGVRGSAWHRRHTLEPACNICGMESGYTGPGAKTVLPSLARAKVDFRLVPDQRPQDILVKLKAHLAVQGFEDIQVKARDANEMPARTAMDSPFVGLVRETARDVYGVEPLLVPNMAGSGPMYLFSHGLGLPIASAGVDYPDNHIHAPNENIRLEDYRKGILHLAAILDAFGSG
ncbi:MAG: M20/M25/M40 family metallo-hydrolase [Chloroflexota bacterium]|nr:M20/M25/M40 family metallo-hydrolase [Chloroflexota bacterium]